MAARAQIGLALAFACGCAATLLGFSSTLALPARRVLEYGAGAGVAFAIANAAMVLRGRADGLAQSGPSRRAAAVGLLFAASVACLAFGWALEIGFLADDFFELTYALQAKRSVWVPQPDWHHYFPLGLEVLALPYWIVGWRPLWFHLHSLVALCLVATCLVKLAGTLGVDRWDAALAGALCVAFPLAASAGIWAAIIKYTYCALFAVLAVLAAEAFCRSTPWWPAVLMTAATGASMLCMEQGAAVVLLCWALLWLRRSTLRAGAPASVGLAGFGPPLVVIAILAWKGLAGGTAVYPGMSWANSLRTAIVYAWSLLTPGWSAGLQVGLALANRGGLGAIMSVALLVPTYALVLQKGGVATRFGVLWALASGIPIVLGAPGVVSRYYVLPGVGVALALAGWASDAAHPATRVRRRTLLVCVIVGGVVWIHGWRPAFERAARITRQFEEDLRALVPADTPYEALVLVDLPSHVGEWDWPATALATGPRVIVGRLRGDGDLAAVRDIRIWRTSDEGWMRSEAVVVSPARVQEAASEPGTLVLTWDASRERLVRAGAATLDATRHRH